MADDLEHAPTVQGGQESEPQPLPAEKKQRDLRQEITDRMVEALERGEIPWERPWDKLEHGLPRNMATGNAYKGGNRLLLQLVQMDQGYADPRFGTVKQINELGGRVKKGEKGHPIELWKDQPFWERRDVDISLNSMRIKVFGEGQGVVHVGMPTDKESTLDVKATDLKVRHKGQELTWGAAHKQLDSVVGRVYTVFNAEQCTGLKIEPLKTPDNKIPVIDRAEQLMTAMREDGLRFATHPQHAFYSPKRDEVSLPPRESFKSVEGYYGTALHEIGHATGAQQRLNREGITGGHRFGSEGYAKEELRAELFSTFMAAETGIPHDEEQHKAYVQSWAKVLKQDKNEIFRAAAEAGKAVDYVLEKERSLQVLQERQASAKTAAMAAEHAQSQDIQSLEKSPTINAMQGRVSIAIDDLNPDLKLGVEAYSFLLADRGPGRYSFNEFADTINARYASPNAQAIADAFRAIPGGEVIINPTRTVSVTVPDAPLHPPEPHPLGKEGPQNPKTRHEALIADGWERKPSGSYEKTFFLAKDKHKGGEFTRGKEEAEKILTVKSSSTGFAFEKGWDDIPIPIPAEAKPEDVAHILDQAAKEMLAKEHAHLGVNGVGDVRGANEPRSLSKKEALAKWDHFKDRNLGDLNASQEEKMSALVKAGGTPETVKQFWREVKHLNWANTYGESPWQTAAVLGAALEARDAGLKLHPSGIAEQSIAAYETTQERLGIKQDRETPDHAMSRGPNEPKLSPQPGIEVTAPHEMTSAQFARVAGVNKLGPGHGRQWEVFLGKQSLGFADGPTPDGALAQVHKREVNNALYDNQPGAWRPDGAAPKTMPPAHVLAEYPDLQAKFAEVIAQSRPAEAKRDSDARTASEESGLSRGSSAVRSMFACKPSNTEALCDGLLTQIYEEQAAEKVRVVENRELSPSEYDKFTTDFFAPQPWLDGKGGIDEDGSRHVIEVTAQDRQTLHIDPAGYAYARYVGIPEADVQRVVDHRSLSAAKVGPTQTLQSPEVGAYDRAIHNFVQAGGNEKNAREILDSEMAGASAQDLPKALVFHGFANPSDAERLAADILKEDHQRMLAKEDRKASEYAMGIQSAERDEGRQGRSLDDQSQSENPRHPVRAPQRNSSHRSAGRGR